MVTSGFFRSVERCRDRLMLLLFPNAFGELPRPGAWLAASRNPAEKADLLDVAHRWLVLAGFHDSELEDGQLKNVVG
jgi:hypothetical protein